MEPGEVVVETEEDTDMLQRILKSIDVESGIRNCGGSTQDYLQVLDVVARHGGERAEKLGNMIKEGN